MMNVRAGLTAIHTVRALAIARGSINGAIAFAQGQGWRDADAVVQSIKAAVHATGTDDFATSPAAVDLAEFVRPLSLLGKLPLLRMVPPRVRTIFGTAGVQAYWTGERGWRPASRMSFSAGDTLNPLSVTALLVITEELARSVDGEGVMSRDLGAAVGAAIDAAFIDPTNSGISGEKPASVTSGVTALHSTGSTVAAVDADLQLLVKALADAGSDLTAATFILLPRTAIALAGLRDSNGTLAYPGMTARGGTILGVPAVTTTSMPIDVGSPTTADTSIVLLDQAQIAVADAGVSRIDVSTAAAIKMDTDPDPGSPDLNPQQMTSMYQTHSAAAKITRALNWAVAHEGMVQVLDRVAL